MSDGSSHNPSRKAYNREGARIKEVTSTANPLVKEIKALALKKHRDESGLFLAEGMKLITDALEGGWKIRTLIYNKTMAGNPAVQAIAARSRGADILEVNDKVLAAISRRENPQTVMGIFHQAWHMPDQLSRNASANGDVLLALDRVRDPGNLGTILRTCDAVGVKGVILIGDTTDPFSLEATRATMGSIFHVPLARLSETGFIEWRKGYKGRVAGAHLAGAVDYRSISWSKMPTLLMMGNEQQGLTQALADICDDLVIIPMAGAADSLNLAIATGVMLFEVRRDRLTMENHSRSVSFDMPAGRS